jgi:hypothetical protein
MIQLRITEEERALLVELLEIDIAELRGEIADTDRHAYREMLKNREALMKKMLQEFAQVAGEGGGK